jgi:hypothetical protein
MIRRRSYPMSTSFRLSGLPVEPFRPLFGADAATLAAAGAVRVVADSDHGFPCRVSLRDARAGEALVLVTHEHHAVDSPYRASGPVFVRVDADPHAPQVNELPDYIRSRAAISLRAYDEAHMMQAARICAGGDVPDAVAGLWREPRIAYLHLHSATHGCYLCRVDRA